MIRFSELSTPMRRTGELERFLTPLNARTFSFIVRRSFGNRGADDDN